MPASGYATLPTDSIRIQSAKRESWNATRSINGAEVFTVGYSGHDTSSFIASLKLGEVESVIDIRFAPVSMYKPDFSKRNLERHLAQHGIEYIHMPQLGVPTEVRREAAAHASRDGIWNWYDDNVIEKYAAKNLHWLFDAADHPVALMCVERDPTACHRHRLAVALERIGIACFDL